MNLLPTHTPRSESPVAPLQVTWESLAFLAHYSPAALANNLGISTRTLQRFFKSHYDMKPHEWLRAVRLREAYSRLPTAQSVKEVAIDLGYKQASHFSRDFKDFHGFSPGRLCPGLLPLIAHGPERRQDQRSLGIAEHFR